MGHGSNDKLFITPSEYSGQHGQHGATSGARREMSVVVPFHMCAITHQPWTTPACLVQDGLICEKAHLVAFIEQHHQSPATGEKASIDDILILHISQNERQMSQDPVSMREFTDHSHLVAIRTSGHVYLYDTVFQLNVRTKNMRDLVTDVPFTKSDILTLQDPHDPGRRTMQNMYRTYFCVAGLHRRTTSSHSEVRYVDRGLMQDYQVLVVMIPMSMQLPRAVRKG